LEGEGGAGVGIAGVSVGGGTKSARISTPQTLKTGDVKTAGGVGELKRGKHVG